ncbi:MAG: hypothetical protein Q8R47_05885 [Nanoarchaeota archaeon]|nr:hypothetical protein [Nanoarchaeota archaeon]
MGFWDRFKRKKAVLIHEEKDVGSRSLPEQYPEILVQTAPSRPLTSSMQAASQGKALKTIKRKKKAKRRVMKKRSPAKPKKHKMSSKRSSAPSPKIGEGSTNKWMHKERALLDAALRDLNRELSGLRSTRRKLEAKTAELSDNLGSTQNKEIALRTQISELMKKETTLSKKKATAKDKIVDIDQKIEKVRAIQADLKSV